MEKNKQKQVPMWLAVIIIIVSLAIIIRIAGSQFFNLDRIGTILEEKRELFEQEFVGYELDAFTGDSGVLWIHNETFGEVEGAELQKLLKWVRAHTGEDWVKVNHKLYDLDRYFSKK